MLKHVIPQISITDCLALLYYSFFGAIIAGCYGVIHDQITFTISNEYFKKFKFHQFSYADLGMGDRAFVALIGFLATWWVGLIVGWILARRFIPTPSPILAERKIYSAFAVVFITVLLSGVVGYTYGVWRGPNADYSDWQRAIHAYGITDPYSFMRVACIHNASYIGGVVGLFVSLFLVR